MKTAAASHPRTTPIGALGVAAADFGPGVQDVNETVGNIVESCLLMAEATADGRVTPVDPEIAAASLVSSVEREIYRRRELIDRIRGRIEVFRRDPAGACRQAPAANPVDYLVGSLEVRGFIKVASDTCREEILVLQSNEQDAAELLPACLPLLGRGVAVRIICQHRSRADLSGRMEMKKLTDAGAAVSTVSHLPRSAAVFDRSLAALFGPVDGEPNVARVHSRVIVQFLLDQFNHLWEVATPLCDVELGYADVAGDLQLSIARLMAKGYTDERVARKLGMSVRSCRRHIAALMRDLDATSRFQAGVQAGRRLLPDTAQPSSG